MAVSERIKRVALLSGECETVYDIGCDHGLLPIHMLKSGMAKRAVFCDISRDSLNKAVINCENEGLGDISTFVCADGLAGLSPLESDRVMICNMGADTILAILKNAEKLRCPAVLSPGAKHAPLRRGLCSAGYIITDEDMVYENKRFYALMRVERGEMSLTPEQELLGPILIKKRPAELDAYVEFRMRALKKAQSQSGGAQSATDELNILARHRG